MAVLDSNEGWRVRECELARMFGVGRAERKFRKSKGEDVVLKRAL